MEETDQALNQADYQETPYNDSQWEIVGESGENQDFVPLEVPLVSNDKFVIDPMFANYGGVEVEQSEIRWHLPQGDTPETLTYEERLKTVVDQMEIEKAAEIERISTENIAKAQEEITREVREEYESQMQHMNETIKAIFEDLNSQIRDDMKNTQVQAADLAMHVAKKIIETAVEVNPEYIVKIVHEALEQAGTAAVRKIRVSPEDMEFVDVVGVRKLIRDYDGSWDFEADETISSGCVVESTSGEIDFQLDAAWDRIRDQVVKVIR